MTHTVESLSEAIQRMEARIEELELENRAIKTALREACNAIERHDHEDGSVYVVDSYGGGRSVVSLYPP